MSAADQIFRRSSVAAIPYGNTANTVEGIKKCPFVDAEHQRIKEKHPTLASTGCSKDFCQTGRAIHTDEPRVGENHSLEMVCQEAADFLRDLYDEGFFHSEAKSETRLQEVKAEILYGATGGIAREHKLPT